MSAGIRNSCAWGDGWCSGRVSSQRWNGHPGGVARKRRGRDGIVARAFENAVYYVFANSVGPQGGGKWSAGDSKIVAPDGSFLQLADNRREMIIVNELDLSLATRSTHARAYSSPGSWRPTGVACSPSCKNECARPIACSVAGTVWTSRISDNNEQRHHGVQLGGSRCPGLFLVLDDAATFTWRAAAASSCRRHAEASLRDLAQKLGLSALRNTGLSEPPGPRVNETSCFLVSVHLFPSSCETSTL